MAKPDPTLFDEIAARKSEAQAISKDFGEAAKSKLDDVFGS